MDLTALFKMSYGLYVVSAEADGQKAGCVINTATQVTAEPPRMMVAVHKDNVTTDVIARAGAFAVTAIDMTADMPYIGNFGFRTSANFDKFEKYGCEISSVGAPYAPQHACAAFWISSSFPVRTISTPKSRWACTAPLTISSGALSPPIASSATLVISDIFLPPNATENILLENIIKINKKKTQNAKFLRLFYLLKTSQRK